MQRTSRCNGQKENRTNNEKLLVLLPFLYFLASCKKDQELSNIKNQITGIWELATISAMTVINYPPGNGRTIIIRNDGTYERWENNSVVYQGTYLLKQQKDCSERTSINKFITADYTGDHYIVFIDQKLVLESSNCIADGGTFYYRKIN